MENHASLAGLICLRRDEARKPKKMLLRMVAVEN